MRAFSRDAGARGWKLPHAPEHEQGTHYFQSPYDDAVCFSCSATAEWDDLLRAKSKKLRSLERKAEAAAAAAAAAATAAFVVQLARTSSPISCRSAENRSPRAHSHRTRSDSPMRLPVAAAGAAPTPSGQWLAVARVAAEP